MKLHVLLALAALVVGFTVPALAQQKEPPLSEQDDSDSQHAAFCEHGSLPFITMHSDNLA